MLAKYWIHLAELTIAILLAVAVYFSWRADQRDRAHLAAKWFLIGATAGAIATKAAH